MHYFFFLIKREIRTFCFFPCHIPTSDLLPLVPLPTVPLPYYLTSMYLSTHTVPPGTLPGYHWATHTTNGKFRLTIPEYYLALQYTAAVECRRTCDLGSVPTMAVKIFYDDEETWPTTGSDDDFIDGGVKGPGVNHGVNPAAADGAKKQRVVRAEWIEVHNLEHCLTPTLF